MNDYMQKEWAARRDLRALLIVIAAEIPGRWSVDPMEEKDGEYPPRWLTLRDLDDDDGFTLSAALSEKGRLVVSTGRGPWFHDFDGTKQYVHRSGAPAATFDIKRSPIAVGRQIQTRVIEPGREIWRELCESAAQSQKWVNDTLAALNALIEATGAQCHRKGTNCTFYARNLPGEPMIEFRGVTDVKVSMTAADLLALLPVWRALGNCPPVEAQEPVSRATPDDGMAENVA